MALEDTGPVEVDGPSTRRRGLGIRNKQRNLEIREARAWARRLFGNPVYQRNLYCAWVDRTIHPMLEKAIWEMGELMPKGGKRDDLSEVVRGMTILLRKSLSEDPLAEPKKVNAKVILDHPAQEPEVPAPPPRSSIVPPARPKRQQGKGVLRPDEEEIR